MEGGTGEEVSADQASVEGKEADTEGEKGGAGSVVGVGVGSEDEEARLAADLIVRVGKKVSIADEEDTEEEAGTGEATARGEAGDLVSAWSRLSAVTTLTFDMF